MIWYRRASLLIYKKNMINSCQFFVHVYYLITLLNNRLLRLIFKMAEESIRFVIDRLLKPIGVELTVKDMLEAAEANDEVVTQMKIALYQFLAWIVFSSKMDARNWIKKADINQATDVLRLLGFDPFLFNLDVHSQHVLLAICWLIWRCDLFKTLYDPLIPDSDIQYLPPYGEFLTDPTIIPSRPIKKPPTDPDSLTRRITRLYSKISSELRELSDLEMQRETFNWQIRAIDQESSLYSLSLKANIPLLTAHTEALNRAITNSPKIEQIFVIEKQFWDWVTPLANRPGYDPDGFDDMRATPIDWYPPLDGAPYSRHNNKVDELSKLMNECRIKLNNLKFAFGDLPKDHHLGGGYSYDIIRREIDEKMEPILRYEAVKQVEKEEAVESLIPNMSFKDFSDTALTRIISQSEDKCDEIAATSCQKIADFAKKVCEELNLEMHGWESEKFTRKRVLDDDFEVERPAEKVALRAPKQNKASRIKASRPSMLGDLPKQHSSQSSAKSKKSEHESQVSSIPKPASKKAAASRLAAPAKKAPARKPRAEWNY